MRFPRVRYTVRRLMVAVAIVALLTWGEQSRRRWVLYRQRSECFRDAEETYRDCENEVFGYCGMSPPSDDSY